MSRSQEGPNVLISLMKKGWFCVSLEFSSKSLPRWKLRERTKLNVRFFVFCASVCVCVCMCTVVVVVVVVVVVNIAVGLYENIKKNKAYSRDLGFLSVSLFVSSRDFYFRALKTFLTSARTKQGQKVCKMVLTVSNK
jgi:hypothetical protein